MPKVIPWLATTIILLAACITSDPPMWSGEMKNSDEHLSHQQRTTLRVKIQNLHPLLRHLVPEARTVAAMLEQAQTSDSRLMQQAADNLSSRLRTILQDDDELQSLSFTSGDFVSAVTVLRAGNGTRTIINFDETEPHLREQIGFFHEDLRTKIDDIDGYPHPQYAVATRGPAELRLRLPLVGDGFYLGDVTATYALRSSR